LATAAALLLIVQISVLDARLSGGGGEAQAGSTATPPAAEVVSDDLVRWPEPATSVRVSERSDEPGATESAAPGDLRVTTPDDASGDTTAPAIRRPPPAPPAAAPEQTAQPPPPPPDPAQARFEQTFPAQAGAVQDVSDPATTRWAVLIGINEHSGRTRDNLTSRQDAEDLRAHLLALGWRDDHIVLLADHIATRENLEQGIAWLARKTDADSVAVFHYAGHTKQWHGVDVDGDGEVPDEGLWPTDNDRMVDSEFVARMAAVRPGKLWVNIAACEAEGFADPGLRQPGRVLTFSSAEHQKSYEDPSTGNTVYGYFLLEALTGYGDADGDGEVTVEEAFHYAGPRAHTRTERQSQGPQTAVVMDDLGGDLSLRIPPPPPPPRPPPPPPQDEPDDSPPSPQPRCTLPPPLCDR
jgi:hypothetical protein